MQNEFERHATRAFFASAWADVYKKSKNAELISAQEIMNVMADEIDPAAVNAARTLRMGMENANGRTVAQMMAEIEEKGEGDRQNTMEYFGHYAAMQAMGHGVGLRDAFGRDVYESIKVPYVEFGGHSLEKDYF